MLSLKPRHRRKRQNVVEVALRDSSLVSHGQILFSRRGIIAFSISAPVSLATQYILLNSSLSENCTFVLALFGLSHAFTVFTTLLLTVTHAVC